MSTLQPTPDVFTKTYTVGKTQLVWQWLPADLETPVSAYLKLCHDQTYSFLLESIEGGKTLGRYSFIGLNPDIVWKCDQEIVSTWTEFGDWDTDNQTPLESLRSLLASSNIDEIAPDLPPMAPSGLFGYIGYDMVRLIEDIPDTNPPDIETADSIMIRPQVLVIFDNVKNMICLVTPVYYHAGNCKDKPSSVYQEARARLEAIHKKLNHAIPPSALDHKTKLTAPLPITPNMEPEQYKQAVLKAKDYILKGDIFQVVPGQRFTVNFDLPAIELYRSLRRLNPSPFMFLLNFDDMALVGSSPEVLVRVRDNTVTIRPIAGTRPRGKTPQEDRDLAEELLADPKERAEHLMLLDLGRNDVGRVSEYGSVNVTDQYTIERYSHVMHIVSNVEGQLREDMDIIDALFAGFPAGTVSGAPKVRAMEIIDELETTRRGYYAGSVGYLSAHGDMDTCIALRTALLKDGKLVVQAGGGVVADSDPEMEYQESVNKAKALIRAADIAIEDAA